MGPMRGREAAGTPAKMIPMGEKRMAQQGNLLDFFDQKCLYCRETPKPPFPPPGSRCLDVGLQHRCGRSSNSLRLGLKDPLVTATDAHYTSGRNRPVQRGGLGF